MTHRSKAANGHGRSRTLLPTMTVLPEPPEAMRPAAAGLRALDLGSAAIASALAVTGGTALLGLLAGAIAAAYLARWVGERSGLASFHHLLATLPTGGRLRDTLTLGASSALAFWPLAAGLIAGGLTALAADRRRGRPGAP